MSSCVHFAIRDDECAHKVEALLEGLGYEARRDLAELDIDLFAEAAAAAARRYRLTERERQMLETLLRGYTRDEMAEAHQVSRPTIKWHLHNIYTKLGVDGSEAALRKALFLDDPRWLCAPLRCRDALDRLADAADHVVHVGKSGRRSRLELALTRLEHELATIRRDAAIEPTYELGDDQLELPTGNEPPSKSST